MCDKNYFTTSLWLIGSDTATGLDNYADEALSLAADVDTENDRWESCLSAETVLQLPFIKDFVNKVNPQQAAFAKSGGSNSMRRVYKSPSFTQNFSFKRVTNEHTKQHQQQPKHRHQQQPRSSSGSPQLGFGERAMDVDQPSSPSLLTGGRRFKKRKMEVDPREKC